MARCRQHEVIPVISFDEARGALAESVAPLGPREVRLDEAQGLGLAREVRAAKDLPQAAVSGKDGFGVRAHDLAGASPAHPVELPVSGFLGAGDPKTARLGPGEAIALATGAFLPGGVDAVVAVEEVVAERGRAFFPGPVQPGENTIPRAASVGAGEVLAARGERLTPSLAALLAAAGVARVFAHPMPRVRILGVGDELRSLESGLDPGCIYPGNLLMVQGVLGGLGWHAEGMIVPDDEEAILGAVKGSLREAHSIITIGGTGLSGRDLTIRALGRARGSEVVPGVRMAPGRGTRVFVVDGALVFCLPGGPLSCLVGLYTLTLMGLSLLAGLREPPVRTLILRLAGEVAQEERNTLFLPAGPGEEPGTVKPMRLKSPLWPFPFLIQIGEGGSFLGPGEPVEALLLG